jgi:hypothetical protein
MNDLKKIVYGLQAALALMVVPAVRLAPVVALTGLCVVAAQPAHAQFSAGYHDLGGGHGVLVVPKGTAAALYQRLASNQSTYTKVAAVVVILKGLGMSASSAARLGPALVVQGIVMAATLYRSYKYPGSRGVAIWTFMHVPLAADPIF